MKGIPFVGIVGHALRALWRDAMAGALWMPALAIIVAVAALSSVAFFTDRIERSLQRHAGELLAADQVIDSSQPLLALWQAKAIEMGLAHAQTQSFRSVVLAGEAMQLAEIKAVSAAYPLRGQLKLAEQAYGPAEVVTATPPAGAVWLDSRLASTLKVRVGDTITLGVSAMRVDHILSYEPDRGGDLFTIAPRLMMRLADLPATTLVQTGSRIRYRLLVAGPASANWRTWAASHLGTHARLQGLEDARPEFRTALQRARRFLGLAALLSVLLGSMAVAVSGWRFAQRHLDNAAMMRCLGATQKTIFLVFALQVLMLGVIASLLGCLLGYIAQAGLAALMADLVVAQLPAPSWTPLAAGLSVGLLMWLGFALPPIFKLRQVPAMRILRRDKEARPTWRDMLPYVWVLSGLALLVVFYAGDYRLAGYLLVGVVVSLLGFGLFALLAIRLLHAFRNRAGLAFRHGIAGMVSRPMSSMVQIVAYALGITVMLSLTLVREDLMAGWLARIPPNTPNFFLVTIQADEVAALRTYLANKITENSDFFPMIRGRLVAIRGKTVHLEDYPAPRTKRLLTREFNLSWADHLPAHNTMVAGNWNAEQSKRWSVEEGIAQKLGIKVGDLLRFRIAGQEIEAPVANLRKVQWDSFQVNFFVIGSAQLLNDQPVSYITSFYLPETQQNHLLTLAHRFPSVTIIDVAALLTKVREIMDRVSVALAYVFAFSLLAALVVMLTVSQATRDERLHELALLRALGARQALLRKRMVMEFGLLGVLTGMLAALAATFLTYLLAVHVLEVGYHFNPWLWLSSTLLGIIGVGLIGWLSTYRLRQCAVWVRLRED